jgi:Zn-dependent peptidase ImmA (M78 family)
MTNTSERAMLLLIDALVADLFMTTDQELLEEARATCEDLDGELHNIRSEIDAAINSVAKEQLFAARAVATQYRLLANTKQPILLEHRRRMLELFAAKQKQARITIAARNGWGLSEHDIMTAFSDLYELENEPIHSARKPNFGSAPKAEFISQSLGITEPQEIDVEAIAWHLGVRVKYAKLDQCEARIVGTDDAAIITVNIAASPQRNRFSICHELGHWIYHRKRITACHSDEIERPTDSSTSVERSADRFASELLMPEYLFVPIAQSLGRPSMHVVRKLSEIFNASQTATAIRLVELSKLPILLVCHGRNGRRWFARSTSVMTDWVPRADLAPNSSAFTMVFGKAPSVMPPRSVNASNWFERRDASAFEVVEETARVGIETITLLTFKDASAFLRSSQLGGR